MKCRCQVVKNLFDFEVHFYLWPPCEKLSKFFWTEQTPNNLWIRVSLHFSKHSVNLSVCLFVCLSVCQSLVHLSVSQSVCLSVLLSVPFQSMCQSPSVHLSILLYSLTCPSAHPSLHWLTDSSTFFVSFQPLWEFLWSCFSNNCLDVNFQWLEWHNEANVLLAGTADGNVWMWKIPSSDCKTFQGHGCRSTCGMFMKDGKEN